MRHEFIEHAGIESYLRIPVGNESGGCDLGEADLPLKPCFSGASTKIEFFRTVLGSGLVGRKRSWRGGGPH